MSSYREDALARFKTELSLPERKAEGVLQRVLGSAPAERVPPIRPDDSGGLEGIVRLNDGWRYLPEEHPDDALEREDKAAWRRAHITSAVFTAIGIACCLILFFLGMRIILSFAIGASIAALGTAPLVGRLRPRRLNPAGQPGIFLGPDALIVRRQGRLWVFPREQLIAIEEEGRATEDPDAVDQVEYAVTAIAYHGRSGRDESYTLDIQPPGALTGEIAVQERIRRRRLAVLIAWLAAGR